MVRVIHGDCLEVLRTLPDCSVDAVVTDPPYGLSFMGKRWDYDVPSVEVWAECLRVLKPGGHLLAFAGTRTQHRMAVRIEDAGFEIRDMIAWVYGSGFPKSLDVSKAIDAKIQTGGSAPSNIRKRDMGDLYRPHRLAGTPGFGTSRGAAGGKNDLDRNDDETVAPLGTNEARQWQGWGTALKPALEPIAVARKPLVGTVAENVLTHGTGALNIDGCRVPTDDNLNGGAYAESGRRTVMAGDKRDGAALGMFQPGKTVGTDFAQPPGRWPANLIHDGSEEVVGLTGDAARFFYCAKASKADREANNNHPTVKPTALMQYLCRLVTPPGGVVLDPFMGSGSTGKAAVREGFGFIGIEREQDYIEIARKRIAANADLFVKEVG